MNADDSPPTHQDSDTTRLEAFSDGVFAIAITLLVLDLSVPPSSQHPAGVGLLADLVAQWPAYFAYALSFVFILVMWINHHLLFRYIARTDHWLLIFNGLLLMFITVLPFPTRLMAEYLRQPCPPAGPIWQCNQLVAVLMNDGTYIIIAILYNVVWHYAAREGHLLDKGLSARQIKDLTADYRYGPLVYFAAFILAFVSIPVSLAVNFGLSAFFALPRSRQRRAFRPWWVRARRDASRP
jgi:uncharacterized membrane protein